MTAFKAIDNILRNEAECSTEQNSRLLFLKYFDDRSPNEMQAMVRAQDCDLIYKDWNRGLN